MGHHFVWVVVVEEMLLRKCCYFCYYSRQCCCYESDIPERARVQGPKTSDSGHDIIESSKHRHTMLWGVRVVSVLCFSWNACVGWQVRHVGCMRGSDGAKKTHFW